MSAQQPDTIVFLADSLNCIGVGLSSYPPLRAGLLHWKALKWRPRPGDPPGVKDLLAIGHDFWKNAASEFRVRHIIMIAAGLPLIFISAFINVVLSWPF